MLHHETKLRNINKTGTTSQSCNRKPWKQFRHETRKKYAAFKSCQAEQTDVLKVEEQFAKQTVPMRMTPEDNVVIDEYVKRQQRLRHARLLATKRTEESRVCTAGVEPEFVIGIY